MSEKESENKTKRCCCCGASEAEASGNEISENEPSALENENEIKVHRTKDRAPAEKKKLLNRLSRIEGQIRGIRGMVEKNAYCPEVLVQCSAAAAALNAFNRELLSQHIRECVARDIRAGREDTIDELLSTLQKLMK